MPLAYLKTIILAGGVALSSRSVSSFLVADPIVYRHQHFRHKTQSTPNQTVVLTVQKESSDKFRARARARSVVALRCSSSSGPTGTEAEGKDGEDRENSDLLPLQLPPHYTSASSVSWVQKILDSHEDEFGGQPLVGREGACEMEQARRVATAQFAVISHDFLRNAEDPIFVYGALVYVLFFLFSSFFCRFICSACCAAAEKLLSRALIASSHRSSYSTKSHIVPFILS